jgi:hypothetical protein
MTALCGDHDVTTKRVNRGWESQVSRVRRPDMQVEAGEAGVVERDVGERSAADEDPEPPTGHDERGTIASAWWTGPAKICQPR